MEWWSSGAPWEYILVNVTPLWGEMGSYLRLVDSQDGKMEIQWKWVVVVIAIRTTEVCTFSCFKQC